MHLATGVVALLDKSPQMLFWDPETYPDEPATIDDLAALEDADGDPKIYLRSITDSYGKYLVEQGVPEDLFLEGYAGDGENFVVNNGKWLNQGYSSNEVWDWRTAASGRSRSTTST